MTIIFKMVQVKLLVIAAALIACTFCMVDLQDVHLMGLRLAALSCGAIAAAINPLAKTGE